MELTIRQPGIPFTELVTGALSSADSDSQSSSLPIDQPEPVRDLHIPEEFPFSHTHIEELEGWPQRLLHVPTLTSHQWQPGNIYNGHANPSYRAISYTWGRWRLKDDEQPNVKPLPIKNAPWKIPRIDPVQFSVQQMEDVLRTICQCILAHESGYGYSETLGEFLAEFYGRPFEDVILPQVEWVWLDLACIDQRWGPAAALEIGRQAEIFHKADGVAVWLNQCCRDADAYYRMCSWIGDLLNAEFGHDGTGLWGNWFTRLPEDLGWRASVLEGLKELLSDPWWTSLWTLQEAFISSKMILVSGSAQILNFTTNEDAEFPEASTMDLLFQVFKEVWNACKSSAGPLEFNLLDPVSSFSFEQSWMYHMEKSGLSIIGDGHPVALLTAAGRRTAIHDEDRIYGIMQIFNYRLGTSRDPNRSFSAAVLTDELGEALLRDRPAESQLHAFTRPVECGKAWRIGQHSVVPLAYSNYQPIEGPRGDAIGRFPKVGAQPNVILDLSTKDIAGTKFGYFKGRVCDFRTMKAAWNACREAKIRIIPDVTACLPGVAEVQHKTVLTEWHRTGTYQPVLDHINAHLGTKNMIVVALMRGFSDVYGLMLVHVQAGNVAFWHRIGICQWPHGVIQLGDLFASLDEEKLPPLGGEERKNLNIDGPKWRDLEGPFG
jgi:hypothetical protein